MLGDPFEAYESFEWEDDRIVRSVGMSIVEPNAKMWKEGGNLIIEIDMPGVNKDDFSLSLKKDRLSVSAEKTEHSETREEDFFRFERTSKCYRVSETLPARIMPEKASVRYEIGVLRIEAPLDREAGR